MQCTKCGFDNLEGAPYCAQCGTPLISNSTHDDDSGERKVVKLPSDGSEQKSEPNERPWEVRVPKRNTGNPGASGKIPTSRKRTGNTGKIPAIKRPDNPGASGKIPADQVRDSQNAESAATTGRIPLQKRADEEAKTPEVKEGKAVVGASIGGAVAETVILKPAGSAKPGEPRPAPTPRRMARDGSINVGYPDKGDGGKKKAGLIIGIIVACCLIAVGVFLLTSGQSTHVVTFETNGGSTIAEQHIIDGGKVDRPANPTRKGYTFDGWYLDKALNDPADFPLTVNGDITLYAKWLAGEPKAASSSSSSSTSDSGSPSSSGALSGASGGYTYSGGSGSSWYGSWNDDGDYDDGGYYDGSDDGDGDDSGDDNGGGSDDESTARVTVIASDGETLTGIVHLKDGYVIPDSSEKAYTIAELEALDLNDAELCIARNEPYARLGYKFANPGLQAYFDARSWYHNSGEKPSPPEGSPGWITAHNLRAIALDNPSARKWLYLES